MWWKVTGRSSSPYPWHCTLCQEGAVLYAAPYFQFRGNCQRCRKKPDGLMVGVCTRCEQFVCFRCLELPDNLVALLAGMRVDIFSRTLSVGASLDPPHDPCDELQNTCGHCSDLRQRLQDCQQMLAQTQQRCLVLMIFVQRVQNACEGMLEASVIAGDAACPADSSSGLSGL